MIVKLLLGQICAGKTTYAMNLVKRNNYIRLSMDDLKIMMFNSISSDKKKEDIISASIENILHMIDGVDDSNDVVVDGFPLDLESIRYLISLFQIEITVFTVDLFKANKRNRKRAEEDGIFVNPEEIKRYNENFLKFVNSQDFRDITKNVLITYMFNYEKKEKLNLVM